MIAQVKNTDANLQPVFDFGTPTAGVGYFDGFAYKTVDGGNTWRRLGNWIPVDSARAVLMPNTEWALIRGLSGLYRINMADGEYSPVASPYASTSYTYDLNYGSDLLAYERNNFSGGLNISKSLDGGLTWRSIPEVDWLADNRSDYTPRVSGAEGRSIGRGFNVDVSDKQGVVRIIRDGRLAQINLGSMDLTEIPSQPGECAEYLKRRPDSRDLSYANFVAFYDRILVLEVNESAATHYCVWNSSDTMWRLVSRPAIASSQSHWSHGAPPAIGEDGRLLVPTVDAFYLYRPTAGGPTKISYPTASEFAAASNSFFGRVGFGMDGEDIWLSFPVSSGTACYVSRSGTEPWAQATSAQVQVCPTRLPPTPAKVKELGAFRVRGRAVSNDGGSTWRDLSVPRESGVPTLQFGGAGIFFDDTHGFVLDTLTGRVAYTADGALTWVETEGPRDLTVKANYILAYSDADTAWVKTRTDKSVSFSITVDFGRTWQKVLSAPLGVGDSNFSLLSGRRGGPWLAQVGSKYFLSKDTGATWQSVAGPVGEIKAVGVLDSTTWATSDSSGCVRTTKNSGGAWSDCAPVPPAPQYGTCAADNFLSRGSELWRSTCGGDSANILDSKTGIWRVTPLPGIPTRLLRTDPNGPVYARKGFGFYGRVSDGGDWVYMGNLPDSSYGYIGAKFDGVSDAPAVYSARNRIIYVTSRQVVATTTFGDWRH